MNDGRKTGVACLVTLFAASTILGCAAEAKSEGDLDAVDASEIAPAELRGLTLPLLADAIENARVAHPSVDVRSAPFRRLVLDEAARLRTRATITTRSYYLPGTGASITSAEASLLLFHPLNALTTRSAADDALALANAWFPGDQYQTVADAFRHAYWNVAMAKRIDVTWAEQYGNAHESESSGDDMAMDLNNNQVGRDVYNASPTSSEHDLATALYWHPKLFVTSAAMMSPAFLVHLK